jgi:hypothetical protein
LRELLPREEVEEARELERLRILGMEEEPVDVEDASEPSNRCHFLPTAAGRRLAIGLLGDSERSRLSVTF